MTKLNLVYYIKKILSALSLTSILILIISINSLASEIKVKSLQYYVNNNINSLPVYKLGSRDKLNIYFEAESDDIPAFAIHFKACDKNWEPYDNLLVQGTRDNAIYNITTERLPSTTRGANYFVSESFPNNEVQFNVSGNWEFYITDSYDKETIYEFGRFFVVEGILKLKIDVQNW